MEQDIAARMDIVLSEHGVVIEALPERKEGRKSTSWNIRLNALGLRDIARYRIVVIRCKMAIRSRWDGQSVVEEM